tara:strand:+ start:1977 stop:3101 length:1125 start_codon:yes stop_codon:yes gene_type:complete
MAALFARAKRYQRIVLHAGLSKTGTTSIQHNCARHRNFLEQHGIVYPVITCRGEPFANHAVPLIASTAEDPQRYVLGFRQRFGEVGPVVRECRQQLDALLAKPQGEVLLLSGELVEGLVQQDMQALRDYLLPHAHALQVVAYFRSPQSGLESLLAERLKVGAVLEPAALVGRIQQKYANLHGTFADVFTPQSYHTAMAAPAGVVGHFFRLLGLPPEEFADLDLTRSNERMSLESFRLMRAINVRYPRNAQAEHGIQRSPRDLNALLRLRGEPFRLEGFAGSAVYAACLEEAAWLEQRLGFRFPAEFGRDPGPQWQPATLAALPSALQTLPFAELRSAAAEFLLEEADAIQAERPPIAHALRTVAAAVSPPALAN